MGTQRPFPKKGPDSSPHPQASAHFYCGQTVGCMKIEDATWYGGKPWPRRFCVRWGPSTPPEKSGQSSQFSAHVYCSQTAGCIKMSLDMEVGLSSGDFVLDGDPAPSLKRADPKIFGPCLLWPNCCMDQDATWYGGRPRPRQHCVTWGPSSPSTKKWWRPLPNFLLMSIVAIRQDGSRWHLAWRWALVQATLC